MRVCLVAIAKNEGRFLPEWLAHYIAIGVDHIFLFDNESSDRTGEIVKAAARRFPITYVPWRTPFSRSPQVTAYDYAIKRLVRAYAWVCFFDLDEFLVLKEDSTIQNFLARYDAGVGAIAVNWLTFGSSGREQSDYALVTDAFRLGGPRLSVNNKHIKTIARTGSITRMGGVHCAELKSGSYIHPDGEPLTMPQKRGKASRIDHSLAQLNHYQVKSKADFDEKIGRGRAGKKPTDPTRFRHNPEVFFSKLDRNSVAYDDIDNLRAERLAVLMEIGAITAVPSVPA